MCASEMCLKYATKAYYTYVIRFFRHSLKVRKSKDYMTQYSHFACQSNSPGFIVMKMPTVGTHFIISPMKLKISFLSRMASCTLFTWTATTDNTSTEIRLNSVNKYALTPKRGVEVFFLWLLLLRFH